MGWLPSRFVQVYESLGTQDLIQIVILAVVILAVMRFLGITSGTGSSLSRGLGLVVLGLFLIVQVVIAGLDLTELATVLDYLLITCLVGMLIIFQPELRRGLMALGRSRLWRYLTPSSNSIADCLGVSANHLSRERVGALIAIQREVDLGPFVDTGQRIDGKLSAPLVQAIFQTRSPLHDGAIIVVNGRIGAAACQLPLGGSDRIRRTPEGIQLGMRHRAALGLSEETDAVVLVVSEETGRISLAIGGRFEILPPDAVASRLTNILTATPQETIRLAA